MLLNYIKTHKRFFTFLPFMILSANAFAMAVTLVPSGVLASKPIISQATFAKIARKNDLESISFNEHDIHQLDQKFNQVVSTLSKEHVFEQISKIAPMYGVKPEAVAGCIIGEHVFNVHLADKFQGYFINAYSRWLDKHNSIRDEYLALMKEPDIAAILADASLTDYEKWDSIFSVYNLKHRGRKNYPNQIFILSFFNPYGAGLTYGLGQLSPVRVLLTNDLAVKYGHLPKIEYSNTEALYMATLDVNTNIHYVAASVLASTLIYKKYAFFDISQNIGLIATLYNLGDEKKRAISLAALNEEKAKKGQQLTFPVENFYGWYINKKEGDIKKLFNSLN